MNARVLRWALAALAIATCVACHDPAPVTDPWAIDWDARAVYATGLVGEARADVDQLAGATVYRMDVEIPTDLARLVGREEIRYTNREAQALDALYLHLLPNYSGGEVTVTAVQVDGRTVTAEEAFERTVLRLPLDEALAPGDAITLAVDFSVSIPREMGGKYGLFGYFEGVLVLDTFYPAVAAYERGAWQVQAPSHNGHPIHLDPAFYLVRVTAPPALTLITTGVEVGRTSTPERQTVCFAAGPARDFYIAASERYVVVRERLGETTVNSYALDERPAHGREVLGYALDALERYSARFGPYPYTEMDILSTPMRALGVMYPGAMGISLTLSEPGAAIRGLPAEYYLEATVAHEVAHQWFGNVVGTDSADETWISEALAQYAAWLYFGDVQGAGAAAGFRRSWFERWERIDRHAVPLGLPAHAFAEQDYGPIIYGRGPLFIEALADEMGQEALDAALRDYVDTYRWETATGEGFRALAERRCACDLGPVFAGWIYPQ